MAGIITGMEIPRNCVVCCLPCQVKDLANIRYSRSEFFIAKDCPIKSVEGLIQEIKDELVFKVTIDEGTDLFPNQLVDVEVVDMEKLERLIKEYCEVK